MTSAGQYSASSEKPEEVSLSVFQQIVTGVLRVKALSYRHVSGSTVVWLWQLLNLRST